MSAKSKITIAFLLFGLLVAYCVYVSSVFSRGVSHQIVAATTKDSYRAIPNKLALYYLYYGPTPAMTTKLGQPVLSFSIAGCGLGADCEKTIEVIDILIEKGADLNRTYDGMSLICEAVLLGEIVIVKALLERGADLNTPIDRQGSPVNGMNADQFVNFLVTKDPERYKEIEALF